MPKRIFITGIPTSGKSFLAKKLAERVGGEYVSTDDMRVEMSKIPEYKKWTDFYFNLDEKEYYENTSAEERWTNLVNQSEAMWPYIKEKIFSNNSAKPIIFEGVNILPHLAKRDLPFTGIALIGKSIDDVYMRLKECPRWGETEELWKFEASSFFDGQRPRYRQGAIDCGYRFFETADDAFEYCVSLLS